ncbi:MAG: translation elongation factor Ts [Clostridia bacterium]|nr:translation elongation factor Ts [Clostridia bacterium]
MAEINAKVVMDLRGRTGCGMMDCKKALAACEGDIEKAIDYLREKGLAKAAKKQSRIAAEGVVGAYVCSKCNTGALVEVNCETDFVANTPEFKELVENIAKTIIKCDPADVDALLTCKLADSEMTVSDAITEKTAKIGEKISVRRFARYHAENGTVDSYIHMGGKVGVLLLAECEVTDAVKDVLHDVSLQIAAASPVAPEYVNRTEVKAEHLQHETEILAAQARNEGKPEKIIEKMVQGRINKFYQEVCLLEQLFVKDDSMTVEKMIAAKAPGTKIVAFTRYKMGDGLEKKVSDLAAEVAEQTKMK